MKKSPLHATESILDALRPDWSAAKWRAKWQDNLNWDDVAIRAIVLGLAPQLYHRVSEWELDVPIRAFAKLKVTHAAQAKRADAIYEQLAGVLAASDARGIRPIALKGAHLAAHIYPEPALRPMNDIDLLFEPEQLPKAEEMLSELGYGGKHKSAETGAGVTKHTSTFKRDGASDNTPNPYLSAKNDRMIEPHNSIEESWYGLKVNITPGIRQRAELVQFGDQNCRVLAREDLLLHVCVHFCFHLIEGAPSLVQFTDIMRVTSAGNIDWQTFTQRALERRAAPYALAGLMLAQKLLSAPVPTDALQRLADATPAKLRDHIATLGLTDILKRSQQKPVQTLSDRIKRGVEDRAATAQWSADFRSKIAVWRTLIDVFKTDTGRMLLGKERKTVISG